jgi:hypothetical protein
MDQTTKVTTMLRTSSRLPLLASCLTLLLAAQAGLASARQAAPQSAQQATPASNQNQAPPKLERVEPGSDVPATNIPSRERTQIKETRNGGQVTEVEVNSSGSHYTMKSNMTQPGNAVPGTVTGNTIRAPQWKVGEFDLSGRRRAANEAGTNVPTADAPPPPPPPAEKK